ncbi:DUF637 domain-containing protein [Pandoraea pneumonica]|uniref:DUF637 domain-containing protein n=1 Tax=Pandoraea pneumonica TaxID=2508299 RepID=UPI003CEDB498
MKEYADLKKAREQEKDPVKLAELDRRLEDVAKWAPGGTYRQIVTVISAAAAGNVSAGVGEFVQRAAVSYLQTLGVEKVKQIADDLDSETARAALQGIVGCAGAAASGGNCSSGALGASASVVLNNLINVASDTNSRDITPSEKEARMNLVQSIVAGIAATDGTSAAAASAASRLEMENNQFQLPAGIVSAGAASASLGEFMAKNGASAEEIQTAQADLLRGLGTNAAQPATELLKSWAAFISTAPALISVPTVGAASLITGGIVSGTANSIVQVASNGEKPFSYTDALIAIAVGSMTQGKGIFTTGVVSSGGAYIGSKLQGNDPTNPIAAAGAGAVLGGVAGKSISRNLTPGVTNKSTSELLETITGSVIGEGISTGAQKGADNFKLKNENQQ